MIAAVLKPVLFITLCWISLSCDQCKGTSIFGEISSPDFKGMYLIDLAKSGTIVDRQKLELSVSFDKSKLDAAKQSIILSSLQTVENWTIQLNNKTIHPSIAFSELSNTMGPKLNVVLPVEIDSTMWQPTNTLKIVFNSSAGSFQANADPNSINCFLKEYYTK